MADPRFAVSLMTSAEAARSLAIPPRTVQRWASTDDLLHSREATTPKGATLPFIAVVEVHVLRALREAGLRRAEVDEAVARLRVELGTEYALASARLATSGRDLLVSLTENEWERARDGQKPIAEVLQDHLTAVQFGSDELPERLTLRGYAGGDVVLDPRFAFGRPVFEATKVRVDDVVDAFSAGEDPGDIATQFGLTERQVWEAVRPIVRAAAS